MEESGCWNGKLLKHEERNATEVVAGDIKDRQICVQRDKKTDAAENAKPENGECCRRENDANQELALNIALPARLQNGGQSCIAAKRFFLESWIAEDFVPELVKRVAPTQLKYTLFQLTSGFRCNCNSGCFTAC